MRGDEPVASYLDYLHKDWLKKPSPLEIYDLILCSTRRAFNMVENLCLAKWIGWGMKEENKVISVKKPYVFFENVHRMEAIPFLRVRVSRSLPKG